MGKEMRKTQLKKEGRDAEGRMGGGDDKQERKSVAIAMGGCVKEAHAQSSDLSHSHRPNLCLLSFPYIPLSVLPSV